MSLLELLSLVSRSLLVLTLGLTVVDLVRNRDRLRLEIALLFLTLTATILISGLQALGLEIPKAISVVSTLALLSHPYLLLRLVQRLRRVPKAIQRGALLAQISAWVVVVIYPDELPSGAVAAVVAYFVLLEGYSAALLAQGGWRLSGGIRLRMILAAGGAALLAAALLTAGLAVVLALPAEVSDLVLQGFAALAALGLFSAFAPPAWLRHAWRLAELHQFIRSTAERGDEETPEDLLRVLESSASRSMGAVLTLTARRVEDDEGGDAVVLSSGETLVLREGPLAGAWRSQTPGVFLDMSALPSPLASIADQAGARAVLFAPIQAAERHWGGLFSFRLDEPIFPDDDLALLSLLVEQAGHRISQAVLLGEQQALIKDLQARTAELARRELYIEQMQDPLWVLDENDITIDINPALERLIAYSEEEILGRSVFDFFDERNQAILRQEFEKRQQGETSRYEIEVTAKDGTQIPVILTGSPIVESGEVIGKIGVLKDIRERKSIEQRLAAANRELEAFTYSVSHDLRAPLRAIDGFSRILVRDHADQLAEEARGYLDRVRLNTQQMGSLIDDLLAFSRIGRQALRRDDVNATRLVEQALEELESERRGRNVEIRLAELPPCSADPALLKILFVNLLSNALKYTRGKGRAVVEVGCEQKAGGPVYFVRDNGVGFDMAYADKLFSVFQRLHRAEDYEGTGVGLATVQRIVHRHGGRIWAVADVDRGATFRFTLGKENDREPST